MQDPYRDLPHNTARLCDGRGVRTTLQSLVPNKTYAYGDITKATCELDMMIKPTVAPQKKVANATVHLIEAPQTART